MRIQRITLGSFATNCYIAAAENADGCVVIDPADNGAYLLRLLEENGLTPDAVLLTHGHYDHFLAVPALQEKWDKLPVYVHPADCPTELTEYDMGQVFPTATALKNRRELAEGETVDIGSLSFRVLHTPGHTPGSVSLLAGDVLFTGDTLFCGSIGRTDFAGGDDAVMRQSLARLKALDGDYRVYPGHEGETTLERERRSNPYLLGIDS